MTEFLDFGIVPLMNSTHTFITDPFTTTSPETPAAPTVPTTSDSLGVRVYHAMSVTPGKPLRADDIADLLVGVNAKQVRGVLRNSIGPNATRYPHVHRIERGVYVYDEARNKRTWVASPKRKVKKASSKPKVATPAVVEAKRPADQALLTGLRPVPNASVMQDGKGNLYVVRATLVS